MFFNKKKPTTRNVVVYSARVEAKIYENVTLPLEINALMTKVLVTTKSNCKYFFEYRPAVQNGSIFGEQTIAVTDADEITSRAIKKWIDQSFIRIKTTKENEVILIPYHEITSISITHANITEVINELP